jgi:hypothetical protein
MMVFDHASCERTMTTPALEPLDARLDDQRQVQRTRQKRQRPAGQIEHVPRRRRQAFGGEQFSW